MLCVFRLKTQGCDASPFVCVCKRERDRKSERASAREGERKRERRRKKERERVSERKREREKERVSE